VTLRSLRRNAEIKVIDAARFYRNTATSEAFRVLSVAINELDQINLNAPTKTRANYKAPETAHEAAESMAARAGTDAYRVLMALRNAYKRGSVGLTVDQLEQDLNLRHQSCSARVNQLRDEGWIVDSGQRMATRSGRQAVVWKPSQQGLFDLENLRRRW
jgi:hypothetical protein